jgi:flagellar hook-basal body complex protein FliE
MTQPIAGFSQLQGLAAPKTLTEFAHAAPEGGGVNFQDLLLQSISQVNSADASAQAAIQESLMGGDITQVEVFTAVKKADLSLRMLLQMRNKAMEAYEEIKQLRM